MTDLVTDGVLALRQADHVPNDFYRSVAVCAATGATYRQLDWWQRNGKLSSDGNVISPGSGIQLCYARASVVLVRAYVVASLVMDPVPSRGGGLRIDSRFHLIPAALAEAMADDPMLTDHWLVIEADSVRIVKGDWPTDGALFVDLAAALRYVTEGIAGAL